MDAILAHAVKHGASDIHFKSGDTPSYRIDGALHSVKSDRLMPAHTEAICAMLLEPMVTPEETARLQEYDSAYSLEGVGRFRVNVYRQRGSLCCILRVIPQTVPTIESMGLPETIRKLAETERGLVLVTGATGSGKSTTLAAMIDHINRTRRVHILTIEDPLEYLHQHQMASISQREVGPDTSDFKSALRSALRQDPDVILVGEMRDTETIDIALKAAETGHMVFSTVHTTDASKTINRLVGVFPSDEQNNVRIRLADALRGVISQRLLPQAQKGGRVAACEILVASAAVRDAIREGHDNQLKEYMEKGSSEYGMQTFDHHLIELYRSGRITLEAAKTAATNPDDLVQELEFGGRESSQVEAPTAPPDSNLGIDEQIGSRF